MRKSAKYYIGIALSAALCLTQVPVAALADLSVGDVLTASEAESKDIRVEPSSPVTGEYEAWAGAWIQWNDLDAYDLSDAYIEFNVTTPGSGSLWDGFEVLKAYVNFAGDFPMFEKTYTGTVDQTEYTFKLEGIEDLLTSWNGIGFNLQAGHATIELNSVEIVIPAEETSSDPDKGQTDPSGNDPSDNDPSGNDPSGNDPSGNDPSGNDPSGNDPSGNDPSGNDPSGNDPSDNDPERLPGDVNEDGEIDEKDVSLLRRYVAEWEDIKINESNADVNADKKTDEKDVSLLRRYVAEWDVELK